MCVGGGGEGGGGGGRVGVVCSLSNYIAVDIIKPSFRFSVLLCVLCFQRQPFRFIFYFTTAGVLCHMAAVKRHAILHHSADYNFISSGIIEPIMVTLKNRIPLKPVVEGVCSPSNYIPAGTQR